jgi:hypothetical protein
MLASHIWQCFDLSTFPKIVDYNPVTDQPAMLRWCNESAIQPPYT